MNKLKQIFYNLNYHWHKRVSTYKSIEVKAYSGHIDFSNKVYMLVSMRGINFELSILTPCYILILISDGKLTTPALVYV